MSDLGNKEVMANNIKHYMKRYAINRYQLADKLNVSYTTLSSWLQGANYPRIDKIELMAKYFNIEKSALIEHAATNISAKVTKIPIIGEIACGDPILAEQNIDGYLEEPTARVPSGDVFFLKCKGNSMEPTISNGAYVLIKGQPEVEDGEIAAVLVDDQTEATLKRVHHQGGNIVLTGDNASFPPIILNEQYPGRIIGKAIRVSFDL